MRRAVLIVVVLALAAAAGYAVWTYTRNTAAQAAALGGSGTIEATSVNVSAQTQGRIIETRVSSGDVVKKGQVLFRLDPKLPQYAVDQADQSVRAARAAYDQAVSDDKSTADKVQAAAQLDQAVIQAKIARQQLTYCTIAAPISGSVLDVAGNTGENATPGSALAVVGDTAHLTVSIYVPESQIGQVKVGQNGTLTTDSSAKTFDVKVTSVASQAEFTPASIETKDQRVKLVYQVKLDVTNQDGILKPGMPADVRF